MKKKVLTMFLAVCLAAGSAAVPGEAFAAEPENGAQEAEIAESGETTEDADWEWEVQEDGTVSIMSYKGTDTEVAIPASIDGKAVSSIGNEAFYGCMGLKKVTIPDSVTKIGWGAFGSAGLEEISIPEGVTTIRENCFSMCENLKVVNLPSSVTAIEAQAFMLCESLEDIILPENLISIGDEAFGWCWKWRDSEEEVMIGLSAITIPAKVTSVGRGVFAGSYNLKKIEVAEGNSNYKSVDGVLFNQAKTELVIYPSGKEQEMYEVPEGVQKIGAYAFQDVEKLSEVTLPSSLQEIGDRGFENMNIQAIRLPAGLKKIGSYAFSGSNFTEIAVPAAVTEIGVGAFGGITLTGIHVEEANMAYASENGILFNKDKTTLLIYPQGKEGGNYVIPTSVTEIGFQAFRFAENLISVLVPKQVARIKGGAFNALMIEEITIQNPQCVIEQVNEEGEPCVTIRSEAKIRGHENSTAQAYAEEHENPFEVITDAACAHNYIEQVTKEATCTQKGVKTFTCKDCQDSYTEDIPVIDHAYGEAVITPSTCAKAGARTYTCSFCGDSYAQELPLANHAYQAKIQQAAPGKNGSIDTKCSVCGKISASQAIMAPQTASLSKASVIYNGKAQNVAVTVKDSAGKVIPAANYDVAVSNNINVGEAVVTIRFKGNYSGSLKNTFRILPKGTNITKAAAKSKGFALKWKKQASQTNGYEIQYSTSSKFKGKDVKVVKVKKSKTVSKNISKLKAKKKYYVRIRTYKTVRIDGRNTTLYSSWSKVKKVTTKK